LVEFRGVKDAGVDKLENSGKVFTAAELQGEGNEVLGGHNPGGDTSTSVSIA
jgi:hypothetical protein